MANIYELTESMRLIWSLMENGILEDSDLEEIFDNTKEELSFKLEGYCKLIKNLESDVSGLKAEEKRLSDRRKCMENTIERCKKAMENALLVSGEKKLACGTFIVSIQKNPKKVVLDVTDLKDIPEEYLKIPEPEIDRAKMKEALEDGENLEGIAHLEQSESLRIK